MAAYDPFKSFNAKAARYGWACSCDPTLAFTRSKLALVAKLWRDRAGPGSVPRRSDFDARALLPVISNMTLLEDIGGRYKLRLHGTALTQYAGDHTGRFVDEMMGTGYADSYVQLYDLVLCEARPLRVLWDYQVPAISYLQGESFVAPLAGADGRTSMILSVTYASAKSRNLAAA
jgi:hypothetical protein